MQPTSQDLLGPVSVCRRFPVLPQPMVIRENILNLIEEFFGDGLNIVFVEGEEGRGKTTLLAQFALRHPQSTFCIFASTVSRWSYDLSSLADDLSNQISWFLDGQELTDIRFRPETLVQRLSFGLRSVVNARREPVYFVVDGLDEFQGTDLGLARLILEKLVPIEGHPLLFRFLISGDPHTLIGERASKLRAKSVPLPGFTLDETNRLFSGIELPDEAIRQLHVVCRNGHPGHLASIRRILENEANRENFIDQLPSYLPNLFEAEWKQQVQENDNALTRTLAVLAYGPAPLALSDVAKLVETEPTFLEASLRRLSFLTIDATSGEIRWISNAFRRFASDRLSHLKDWARDRIIDYFLQQHDSREALLNLPHFLEQAGRLDELLAYLSPDILSFIPERAQSLAPLRNNTVLAMQAAAKLERLPDVLRFALHGASVSELEEVDISRTEVAALTALGDHGAATALANEMTVREHRLQLLAAIARTQRERGHPVDDSLLAEIKRLHSEIDYESLGEGSIAIAVDLLHISPELAIEALEKAAQVRSGENALDWAFVRLSLEALSRTDVGLDALRVAELIAERTDNPSLRQLSEALRVVLGNYSASEVIAKASSMESASRRLYVLRNWTVVNRTRPDATDVVRYALQCIVETGDYSPNATLYRELATPLPYVDDLELLSSLVKEFDGLKGSAEALGPTADLIRLELTLAAAERKYDLRACANRLVTTFLNVSAWSDLSLKAECLARILDTLANIDADGAIEQKEGLRSVVLQELNSTVVELLQGVAEQFDAFRRVIRTLARCEPTMAFNIAQRLNTEPRRNQARRELIYSILESSAVDTHWPWIQSTIDTISDSNMSADLIVSVLSKLYQQRSRGAGMMPLIRWIADRLPTFEDPKLRLEAECFLIAWLLRTGQDELCEEAIRRLNELDSVWSCIGDEWSRLEAAFRAALILADDAPGKARDFVNKGRVYREQERLFNQSALDAQQACLLLANRAFSGLMQARADIREDARYLLSSISRLPSASNRAILWADLAVRCYLSGRQELVNTITDRHLLPLLDDLKHDSALYARLLAAVAPALYCNHPRTALQTLHTLPTKLRDRAYAAICDLILTKRPPSDPWETTPNQAFRLRYEDAVDICDLLELMSEDAFIYHYVRAICASLSGQRARESLSREQQLDLLRRLTQITDTKFPSKGYIEHEGYRLVGQAQIYRLRRATAEEWNRLIEQVDTISNISDRAFILCQIAEAAYRRHSDISQAAIFKALDLIRTIPHPFDRLERLGVAAEVCTSFDLRLSKTILHEAIQLAHNVPDTPGIVPVLRWLTDIAHKVDPDLAASWASITDPDPAKTRVRSVMAERYQVLEIRRRNLAPEKHTDGGIDQYAEAAWAALASLVGGRFPTVHVRDTLQPLQLAGSCKLSESYPIFCWAVENAIVRHARAEQHIGLVRGLFEACQLAADLCDRLADRGAQIGYLLSLQSYNEPSSRPIGSGERAEAIKQLTAWLARSATRLLIVHDPYFGPDDLELLLYVKEASAKCKVYIVTSKQHHDRLKLEYPWDESYRRKWRLLSDADPPHTEIVILGVGSSGQSPIHDRWWLGDQGGLSIGTSFGGLGRTRASDIKALTQEEYRARLTEVMGYVNGRVREHLGQKVHIFRFNLV